ncbi:serine hydrolase domain-containing protein [Hymenobacter sp. GOD-10R]|uniref:serine hydrolase domain-containing protein n=1 Tax=Hymenobacter sp. GOD-10R TaxID=3093922 RepID=UPI002D76AE17|nr:serine hydrolase domain-containing protein [Hymenobacter sp. GOD-10R]WRQ31840.1 serine hydrolase domain-containing protein [Hymenobacter sp. GOD-10R]
MNKPLLASILAFASLGATAQVTTPAVDSLVKAYVAINKFNGTAVVVREGKIRYQKSYGYQNATAKRLNAPTSIFPIGSLTKSFTALVVLKLAEEHKLSLDNSVSQYIPDYPRGKDIQIRHLLTNTSGIYEKFRNRQFYEQLTSTRAFSTAERLAFFQQEPLDFEPGTKFSYSNSGFDLLGLIIEQVTGRSYAEAVRTYILSPLHMTHTGLGFAELQDAHKTKLYAYLSATKTVEVQPWNASLTYSSGGLYSSAEDLLKFYYGLSSFQIISPETFAQATTPFLGGYGYGWYIDQVQGERVIDHGGNIEGATSYFLLMPEHRIGIILLNNITSTSLEKLGTSLYAALRNKPYRVPQPKKAIYLPEAILAQYVGTFEVSGPV